MITILHRLRITLLLLPVVSAFSCDAALNIPRYGHAGRHVPQELLVKFRPGAAADAAIRAQRASVIEKIPLIDVYRVRLPKGRSIEQAQKAFAKNPNVVYATPNHIVYPDYMPNDELYMFQWALYNPDGRYDIHAEEAWDITTGSESPIIAIIDTGIQAYHPDLDGKVIEGYNAIDGSNNTDDDFFHGTFVAGVAAAWGDNYEGVAGVNWNAQLMPVKVINEEGWGTEADAAEGIVWAFQHGARVINLSIGTYDDVQALEDAVNAAWEAGCIICAASGNDGYDDRYSPHYPSYYPATISVGATNDYDERCTEADWFEGGSNYGDSLDVMAPGYFILGCVPTWYPTLFFDYYDFMNGTSASAPHVSGLASLIWSIHPDWTNQQVRDQIERTCDDITEDTGTTPGWDRYTGWGRINAYRALSEAYDSYTNISQLFDLEIGSLVSLPAKVVTAGTNDFGDRFYIEEPDRSAGIMVYWGSEVRTPTSIGDLVEVSGMLYTAPPSDHPDGELAIINPRVTVTGTTNPIRPLGMANVNIGGRLNGFRGVTNGIGLTNTGLLVKTWGKVTGVGWDYFYIDDGSALDDGSGLDGLKIYVGKKPSVKRYDLVAVTGISTIQVTPTGERIRVVRPRQSSDIMVLK